MIERSMRPLAVLLTLLPLLCPAAVHAGADRSVEPAGVHGLNLPLAPAAGRVQRLPGTSASQGAPSIKNVPTGVSLPDAAAQGKTAQAAAPAAAAGARAAESKSAAAIESVDPSLSSFESELGRQGAGVANTGRMAREVGGLRDLFQARTTPDGVDGGAVDEAAKAAPAAPSAPVVAPESARQEPPSPAPASDPEGEKKAWRNGWVLLGALVVAQVGVEAWSAVWNKWVQSNYGMDAYTMTTMTGMVTSLVAGYVGGWLADKVGLKKTLVGSWILVSAIAAATLLLFNQGMLILPMLIGLVVARLFANGAAITAEKTLPIAVFADHKSALGRYNSITQVALEVAGIAVPFGILTLVSLLGAVGTMWLLPITLGVATLITMFFLKLKEGASAAVKLTSAPAPQAPESKPDPKLLSIGRWAYPVLLLLNTLLYSALAIGYGNYLFPGADEAAKAAANGVAGKIVSLFSLGGLFAGLWLSGLLQQGYAWLKTKWPSLPALPAGPQDQRAELKSMAKWLVIGAISLAAFIPMLWTNAWLASLAMIPFGFTAVVSVLQVLSMVQQNAPADARGKVMGGLRTTTTLVGLAGFYAFSQLFKHFPASPVPFYALLGLNAAIGAYYLWIAWRVKKYLAGTAA